MFKSLYETVIFQRTNQALTIQQRDLWSYQTKNDLKNTITSKVTLVLFTHVFLRGHYLSVICCHSLDSVIMRSSDLHQSKVYLSSGLFEIVTQTNHIPLLVMKDCSQNCYDRNWIALIISKTLSTRMYRIAVFFRYHFMDIFENSSLLNSD